MTLLVLGASHRTAPLATLERLVLDAVAAGKLARDLVSRDTVREAVVLSTCNRVEVYVEADRFHSAVADLTELVARHAGVGADALTDVSYIFHDERAVEHLFSVACGLDSLAVGEPQILSQVRAAWRRARTEDTLGPVLSAAGDAALRLAKRAHTETRLDFAAPSLVDAGLAIAGQALDLSSASALVLGAGSMGSLATVSLQRAGVRQLSVASRSGTSAERLVGEAGTALGVDDVEAALPAADLVICCTGAPGAVVTAPVAAAAARARAGRPQIYLDLALPRDVEPEVGLLPGTTLIDLTSLGNAVPESAASDLAAVRQLVAEELQTFAAWRKSRAAAPTVTALRTWAGDVVDAELARLAGRTPEMSEATRAEVIRAVHRVVEKLLHTPTVNLRAGAGSRGGEPYADVVRALFDLDVRGIERLSHPDLSVRSVEIPTEAGS